MPTILTHAAVPVAVGVALGARVVPPRLMLAGAVLAMLPDLDVLTFRFGIAYSDALGHRGFSHSLLFALLAALACTAAFPSMRARFQTSFPFLLIAAVSHGVLDAFTNGGMGVEFLWPWWDARFFAPVRPIEVSPIGVAGFFSARGGSVMASEVLWVWLPFAALGLGLGAARRVLVRARPPA